jgi:hypothetical protein
VGVGVGMKVGVASGAVRSGPMMACAVS